MRREAERLMPAETLMVGTRDSRLEIRSDGKEHSLLPDEFRFLVPAFRLIPDQSRIPSLESRHARSTA